MADSERRQRVISSTPRLSPDDVANRVFASSFRGFAESEVRSFLRRVSEEMAAAREREQQLIALVDELEQELRAPRPLDEQQLLDALGEETARLLRSAREAADDIRKKADERAARVIEEAQEEAQRLRTEAAELVDRRAQEAEARAAELVAEAEARAQEVRDAHERSAEEQRLRAEQEVEGIVEAARQQGREMLDEARAARERVLTDLARRRALLQGQVDELRQGRDHLLDAYRVVKRTFLEATEALAHVEARAAAGKATPPAEVVDVAGEAERREAERLDAEAAASGDEAPRALLADVDSLFARIRAGQTEPAPGVPTVDVVAAEAGEAPSPAPEGAAVADGGAGEAAAAPVAGAAVAAWRERHTSGVSGLLRPLVKRAKRAAQDDQNALLDAVRRHKGRPAAAQVLGDDAGVVRAWADVVRAALDEAYRAGRAAAGGGPLDAPADLVAELASAIVLPVRERVGAAIDDAEADASGLVERIGARYREWKNQQLEQSLADALVVAWSRGVYDATADGALLHWIPLREGRCADCDDNALEPTAKGAAFPTGQPYPPAHPGCRCLLAPVEVLAATSARA
jgi:DivIVA domain-containing protein